MTRPQAQGDPKSPAIADSLDPHAALDRPDHNGHRRDRSVPNRPPSPLPRCPPTLTPRGHPRAHPLHGYPQSGGHPLTPALRCRTADLILKLNPSAESPTPLAHQFPSERAGFSPLLPDADRFLLSA